MSVSNTDDIEEELSDDSCSSKGGKNELKLSIDGQYRSLNLIERRQLNAKRSTSLNN